ncbi:Protoheme IX farnesyltransferase mitochondrial [Paragonimus heterotremus]|uniref:Protoheme IX farnesyltransferase, mitochondrial n=1 Tax=Paragonimus heterotremus TaxID=100268 RepID=A0A8J4SUY5_9TREM|nr:Protoheme IX farnesyltransferase mitochondrial [Paragonimus heterotremus]
MLPRSFGPRPRYRIHSNTRVCCVHYNHPKSCSVHHAERMDNVAQTCSLSSSVTLKPKGDAVTTTTVIQDRLFKSWQLLNIAAFIRSIKTPPSYIDVHHLLAPAFVSDLHSSGLPSSKLPMNSSIFYSACREKPSGDAVLANRSALSSSLSSHPDPRSACPDSSVMRNLAAPVPTELINPVLTVHSVSGSVRKWLTIAAGLSKVRLSSLVVSTAVVGCTLAASTTLASPVFLAHPVQTAVCLAIGTGLVSAAANTVNQIIEIPFDSQMVRTRNRVLVRGITTPGRAGLFALCCAGSGLGVLYFLVNPLVAGLAAANMFLYTGVYTPLKQISQANTWIGALVGAVPPLMGWAAATGEIHSGSLILACLLYVWQFPHFMALSWNLRSEYAKAGYMMTAALEPTVCKHVAFRYAIASSLVCLAGAGCSALSLGPWAGCALGLTCLPPNIGLIYYAWQFARSSPGEGSSAAARKLFRATLFHLPVVMTAALAGTYFCTLTGFV